MRVCELHKERAVDTLVSKRDGSEYDLCPVCIDLLYAILNGMPIQDDDRFMLRHNDGVPLGSHIPTPQPEKRRGRGRTARTAQKIAG